MKKKIAMLTVFFLAFAAVTSANTHDAHSDSAGTSDSFTEQNEAVDQKPEDVNGDGTIGPGEIPQIEGKPSTAPQKGVSGMVPDVVPGSPVAQNVLNTIDEIGAGPGLGDALGNLLGGGNETATNQTAE